MVQPIQDELQPREERAITIFGGEMFPDGLPSGWMQLVAIAGSVAGPGDVHGGQLAVGKAR